MRTSMIVAALLSIVVFSCYDQPGRDYMVFLHEAKVNFDNGKFEEAQKLYLQALTDAEKAGDNSTIVIASAQIARCHLKNDDIDSCGVWLKKAKTTASPELTEAWAYYLGVLGRYQWKIDAKEKKELAPEANDAAATFTQMYDFCFQNDLFVHAVDAANMMAIVGKNEDRISWSLKGIEAAENGNVESWLAPLWNNLGWNYMDDGNYKDGLEALIKARDYHYKGTKEIPKLAADWSVGYAYRMLNDYKSAEEIMFKSLLKINAIYEADPSEANAEWIGFVNKEMGELALVKNEKDSALTYFTIARDALKKVGMPKWDEKGYLEIEEKVTELSQ